MKEAEAIKQTIPAIRVVGGLSILNRDRLINAGASVHHDKINEDALVVGVTVNKFEEITGMRVSR